jgi:lyso-ornithine lipid O-acyltransferase
MLLRGLIKSVLTLTWTAFLLPVQFLALKFSDPVAGWIPRIYHQGAARILGLHVSIQGQPLSEPQVLYVANHVSWLDIVALGSVLEAGFIAKSEVASWPGFGLLARLQQSIFIDRRRSQIRIGTDMVSKHLATGKRLILFAEGTSNDGVRILPFQSSFFAVAGQGLPSENVPVQPISITYTRRAGLPLVRSDLPAIAWYGDMFLLPHLWRLFCDGGQIEVILHFHPQVDHQKYHSRKALARYCYDRVNEGVMESRRQMPPKAGS